MRNILLVSLLLSTLLPGIMIGVIYPSFTNLLIESTKESAIRAATHLKSELFFENIELRQAVVNTEFLKTIDTIKNDLDLKKLKIFSQSGKIIFSSDSQEIGNLNKEKYFHEIVAKGKVFAQLVQKNTETLEGQIIRFDVVETYVPVMMEDSFQGAFEIYYDITSRKDKLDALLSQSSILLFTISFGFLFIVISILFKENMTITKRKQAEAALQKAHRDLEIKAIELKEANAELSQYAHIVSHDLQAPLRAISNYVNFLNEDLRSSLEAEHKEYLDAMDRTVHDANELVRGLLKISRIGRETSTFESVQTGGFLKGLIDSLSLTSNVKTTLADDWPTIETDPILLRQIFQNLIENAIKFNNSPEICIELGWRPSTDRHYEFFVRDNGDGIEPRYHEQIFRVFERLHTAEDYDGTGIGLAIVKKAAGKLGGSIRIESEPGEGSTFFITLPRTQETRPD